MFSKILIANRGEIACRIARTARRMGIATVAVYSDADARARHVKACDEAVRIGPPPARESYLRIDAVIDAALRTGAQAIHPGYGFLSENAGFAAACEQQGLVFIGPPAQAIRAMGSKSAAKALMEQAGVPLLPGYHGEEQDAKRLKGEAKRTGYPLLIKAAAGGGGKGMRIVGRPHDFEAALAACRREANSSFGDDTVLIEKYLESARHVEMQVFADRHGGCVHLFERDCSVQRRHQKVLEEAPAPGLTEAQREAMGAAAISAARAVGYVGAGTVEFLRAPDGAFYFMEMNTRLQVEHPVTEMITQLDLVEWQLRVAAGERLPLGQQAIAARGHAIEARIYAEDPGHDFMPSTGRLAHLSAPGESRHVRVDAGVGQGDDITPWYDPMIAKLVVWDESREQALGRMREALAQFRIVGVANNVAFLSRLVRTASFAEARLDTSLIEREREHLFPPPIEPPLEAVLAAALAFLIDEEREAERAAARSLDPWSPWNPRTGWRLNGRADRALELVSGTCKRTLQVAYTPEGYVIDVDGTSHTVRGGVAPNGTLHAEIDSGQIEAAVVLDGGACHLFFEGQAVSFSRADRIGKAGEAEDAHGALLAPMPGRVVAILVEAGTRVEKGSPLLIIEAMKMEHTITAPAGGTVRSHRYAVGDQVSQGAQLLEFEPDR